MLTRRLAVLDVGQTLILPIPAERAAAKFINVVASTASHVRRDTGHLFCVRRRADQVVVTRITERDRETGRHFRPEAERIASMAPGSREVFPWPGGEYNLPFAVRLRQNVRYLKNRKGMSFMTRSLSVGLAVSRIA
ncbi:MAG: hypothetical protein ACEQSH_00610 [Bacteroidia bacterium]